MFLVTQDEDSEEFYRRGSNDIEKRLVAKRIDLSCTLSFAHPFLKQMLKWRMTFVGVISDLMLSS